MQALPDTGSAAINSSEITIFPHQQALSALISHKFSFPQNGQKFSSVLGDILHED
jgi:hypothetical protein